MTPDWARRMDEEQRQWTLREMLRILWHTRPGHSAGIVTDRHRAFCAGCGRRLA